MSLIRRHPSDTYSGDGEASAWVRRGEEMTEEPVSYTHLTLPTIYSV